MPLHLHIVLDVGICRLSNWILFFMSALQNKDSAGEVKRCQNCVLLHTWAGVDSQGLLLLQSQDLLQQELSSDNVSQTTFRGSFCLSKWKKPLCPTALWKFANLHINIFCLLYCLFKSGMMHIQRILNPKTDATKQ